MIWLETFIATIYIVKTIDKMYLLYKMVLIMEMQKSENNFDNGVKKYGHVSLTHLFRREFVSRSSRIKDIIEKCDVSTTIGALPKELRNRKKKEQLSECTKIFVRAVNYFLEENFYDLLYTEDDITYSFEEIESIFSTKCLFEIKGKSSKEARRGAFAFVGKLSFPDLNADYAIKVFYDDVNVCCHGAFYEVATALNAYKAEPKSNNKVHLASFSEHPYMLSDWAGDAPATYINENKFKIFDMNPREMASRNFRNGKRIDFGETYRTAYGAASYKVRKMFRKIVNASEKENIDALNKMFFANYNYVEENVFKEASWLAFMHFYYNECSPKIDAYFKKMFKQR